MATLSIRFIPTSGQESHYTQVTNLDGVAYVLGLDWVQRWQRWTLSISLSDETRLLSGIPLVSGVDLLRNHRYDLRMPQGILTVYDAQNQKADPGLAELGIGREFTLAYVSETE